VEHPREWELAIACGLNEPGRCTFVDRHFQRLDVRWKPVQHVPNLDLILDKHRERSEGKVALSELTGAPPEWRGIVRRTEAAQVVHAGRFYKGVRWIVEATVVWPDRRDAELERAILASVSPQDPAAPVREWEAMGIRMVVGSDFELIRSSAKVGRVRWDFRLRKGGPHLSVERIAMVKHWLKTPLRDWLEQELPPQDRLLHQALHRYNGHEGQLLLSRSKAGIVPTLRGLRRVRLDLAWECPVEARVYHVSLAEVARQDELALPDALKVRCCRRPVGPGAGA